MELTAWVAILGGWTLVGGMAYVFWRPVFTEERQRTPDDTWTPPLAVGVAIVIALCILVLWLWPDAIMRLFPPEHARPPH